VRCEIGRLVVRRDRVDQCGSGRLINHLGVALLCGEMDWYRIDSATIFSVSHFRNLSA